VSGVPAGGVTMRRMWSPLRKVERTGISAGALSR
jgi:hypothetical protein